MATSSPSRKEGLGHGSAVDPYPIAAAEVADQEAVVDLGHAAVPSRDLGQVDPDVAVGVAADQDHGPLQADDRPGTGRQGDESDRHTCGPSTGAGPVSRPPGRGPAR